ncbi:sulfite exporter TauE/SafE family protein [Photobacterium sp. DNB23_23_1]|uniref:Probable membrane transporter protein n=1 Tax=Photobacterium pectinilyticum TaxID=2906793 RepID=A0ABT1N7P7_9GAMM|nr:sulfite exporter TauE/SafE family protein [Photobacterium sp. ZSDE20]MCQ1059259.1 sulfite exporter TauE/SafE family protein [Photobacterium sp. ZSDE20]MDD1824508.1 sulfite exporter TauE/SafE family protein [Photobacterium sp. ZSDE20]
MIVTDPWFYITAVPAVLIYGIGKGGLGGALGIIAVPLMALVVSPTQAAAILLPILCVMDAFAVKQHYRSADYSILRQMLPGSLLGILLAGLFLSVTPESGFKLLIGVLSLLFSLQYVFGGVKQDKKPGKVSAWLWSSLSGFSSTAIHAGGGPASIYLLPLRLEKVTLIATMAVLFAIINLVKLIPYSLLGEFDTTNLMTALVLMPLAPIGVHMGVWLLHRVSQEVVYRLCYLFLFISGVKLVTDVL